MSACANAGPTDALGSRADRHANADFFRAYGDRTRDHRIEPNGGQHPGNHGEDGRHRRVLAQFAMLPIHAGTKLEGSLAAQHAGRVTQVLFQAGSSDGSCNSVAVATTLS
jgi:hypothetical protein